MTNNLSDPFMVGHGNKPLGAFYTDAQIADFLSWWAIRATSDVVLDPSFGGGVFLRSSCKRLSELGGDPASQVFGVEIDPDTYHQIADKLSEEFGIAKPHLRLSSFFDLDVTDMPLMDAVIGNPPFIRYQRFAGETRKKALEQAEKQGVKLSELSSSWAPFLILSIACLKIGGRLAMVVPMEIAHAAYAQPVIRHLSYSFREVTLLTFRKKLFPDLSEDTLLLLAEDKGGSNTAKLRLRDLLHAGVLARIREQDQRHISGVQLMDVGAIVEGRKRMIEYLIPKKARDLYNALNESSSARALGELADVGIGYVTGANDFFHLRPSDVRQWRIPDDFLKPAVRRGRGLIGLRFTLQDWQEGLTTGESGYLLYVDQRARLPRVVRDYIQQGEQRGVSQTYKCRTRSPWYSVPHVYHPDAFLTYMSGTQPRLVANDTDVVAPNSLHILRLHPEVPLTSDSLAALWQTSLTRLSVEIEGHALGGGMLKLEPTEAENVALAWLPNANDALIELADELDSLTRCGRDQQAQSLADDVILRRGLGITKRECDMLRATAEHLRNRRYSRNASL